MLDFMRCIFTYLGGGGGILMTGHTLCQETYMRRGQGHSLVGKSTPCPVT